MTSVAVPSASEILAGVDLTLPRTHARQDLDPLFARLRDDEPQAWHPADPAPRGGFWVLSRHADLLAACRDPRLTSTRGNVLSTLLAGGDAASGRMLAVSDGDRHLALRKALWPSFTPAALDVLGGRIRSATLSLVRRAVELGECDFARDVAAHIPLMAICDLLGVPESDRSFILSRTSEALGSEAADQLPGAARLARAEILLYFTRLAGARRGRGVQDLISVLSSATPDGQPISDEEIVLNCYSLILGGDETTRLSMISAVAALARDEGQWRVLVDGCVPVATATEEILRWTVPAVHLGRTATADIELPGRPLVRAGDVLTAWIRSANFDERAFRQPRTLDLGRRPNRQVTFAFGPHFCLGAHLARIEIAALLTALRAAVEHIEIVAEPVPIYSTFLRGYSSLPVRLHARP